MSGNFLAYGLSKRQNNTISKGASAPTDTTEGYGMGDQHVATYYIGSNSFEIYGCWDKETPENQFDFFDVYKDGECINEGNPFYDWPSWEEVADIADIE
jgi:hypothetical protein